MIAGQPEDPSGPRTLPFGTWPSPLTPLVAAQGGIRFGGLVLSRDRDGRALVWYSALDDGHNALWVTRHDGPPRRIRAVESARSRVNEYGGGAFWVHGESLFWVEDRDQRIRRIDLGDEAGCLLDRAQARAIGSGAVEGIDLSIGETGSGTELVGPPPEHRSTRYAAGVVEPGGTWMVTERELHVKPSADPGDRGVVLAEPVNDLVWLPTGLADRHPTGSLPSGVHSIVAGADFSAAPTLSPDGRYLAWLQWDHPDMPWDAAELWAGRIEVSVDGPSLHDPRRVAGGAAARRDAQDAAVSVCLPQWGPDSRLWWCDDRDDLWVLRSATEPGLPGAGSGDRARSVPTRPLLSRTVAVPRDADLPGEDRPGGAHRTGEVGAPRWVSGSPRYGFVGDEVILVETVDGLDEIRTTAAPGSRSVLDGSAVMGSPGWVDTIVAGTTLTRSGVRAALVAAIAGSPRKPTAVICGVGDGATGPGSVGTRRFHSDPWPLAEQSISVPEPITFATGVVPHLGATSGRIVGGGSGARRTEEAIEVAHGLFYPPALEGVRGPAGELPPLVVRIHGGPTAAARAELSSSVQFWTTRGFAVVDVNYRGSTGFGRAYRDRLRGGWGDLEVADCIAAAEHLASQQRVDPQRCVIRGGSAGGFTALEAVAAEPTGSGFHFAAATTLYGVTDLLTLATDTHKFESRYLDGLIGPLPEAEPVYRQRSPLNHPERISSPVLILQGLEDPVVPPSQAEVLVSALAEAGIDHEYRTYPGEGHGFRNEATIADALETELAFYWRILGLGSPG